jgi:hypothetical protein
MVVSHPKSRPKVGRCAFRVQGSRLLPTVRRYEFCLFSAFFLGGCGDSLISGEALDDLFGLSPVPERVSWEVRWLSDDHTLVLGCELYPARVLDYDDIAFGEISVTPPDAEPEHWIEEDDATWALGFPVLVDRNGYREAPGNDSLHADRGVWGLPWGQAMLFADGEDWAVEERLLIDPEAVLETGVVWVDVLTEAVSVTGDVHGTLIQSEVHNEIWVSNLAYVDDSILEVWSGEHFDGVEPCR